VSGPSPAAATGATPGASDRQVAVDIADVAFRYEGGGVLALEGTTLAIERGRCMAIVGPSGCGKSTLLSLIAGLRKPTAGRIDVNAFDPQRQKMTMMFQKDTLLPWLTVEQNIKLFYRFKRGDKDEVKALVSELVALAHLEGFEKFYPYQLSGGMRRRVAFISTVAAKPELLLLDEPFSSLDEPTRLAIHEDVMRIVRRMNMTMLLVTHDLAEAVSLCDEVAILTARPGRVASRHTIPFGPERDIVGLRKTPEFLQMYGRLWDDLSQQIVASVAVGDSMPVSTDTRPRS
jgi:NitT/TauT family transport system ATP-binding protein